MKSASLLAALFLGASVASATPAAPPASAAGTPPPPFVEGAWVRSAVPGQQGTGAFMKLTAARTTQLVGASTPIAGTAEVHEMKLEGDIMRMRPVAKLELPAGKTVELKPGGYHLMLLDLKAPVPAGSTVPLTLVFRDAGGAESRLELRLPVAVRAPGTAGAASTHRP